MRAALDHLVSGYLANRQANSTTAARPHAYGLACYRPGGCAEIIEAAAERIPDKQTLISEAAAWEENRNARARRPRFIAS